VGETSLDDRGTETVGVDDDERHDECDAQGQLSSLSAATRRSQPREIGAAMEKKVLTIERAKWLRGRQSLLLDDSGHMCCLGFDAIACGVSADLLCGAGTPYGALIGRADRAPASYVASRLRGADMSHVAAVSDAMLHNDAAGLSEDERERVVRKDLMQLGWDDVVFV
jgi:hypothetical protein